MVTERIVLSPHAPDTWADAISHAVELLRAGERVAFPTDTVYGLGADPFNESALAGLFTAKGRPEDKPIALLVGQPEDARPACAGIPPEAVRLMERFWPGPLTLVLPAAPHLPGTLLGGKTTVGVRMPDHPLALALLRAFGAPLAVTSANRSGQPDLCTGEEVEAALGGRIPLLLDGGRTPGGSPSTVVDVTASPPRILREGPISLVALTEAAG
ncbi:MAG: threonylcarbamoyl-AMP synthase [Armatimonadetes bacterium]|nr:threonylcarbamoyl-AMP synthase [Armatimonadota bacterium]